MVLLADLEVLGGGELTPATLQVGEDAVPPFLADCLQRFLELSSVLHRASFNSPPRFFLASF
jgi:hypothetical protein